MVGQVLGFAVGFLVLAAVFAVVERRARAGGRTPWWRRPDRGTDLAWWLTTPLLTRATTFAALATVAVVIVVATGRTVPAIRAELAAGGFPDLGVLGLGPALRAWPLAVQVLAGLLLVDLLGYGLHRAFHRRPLWPLHAVHHSSPRLDWLSSIRVHPLNQVLTKVLEGATLLLVGFDPRVFAIVTPFLTFYALLLHADVAWTFGPLRRVIASPRFHRWHHAADRAARGKNFAGLFAFFDVLFGTYHLPEGVVPSAFGAPAEPVPGRFLAQLAYPFRKARPGERLARDLVG